jgi:hypothetical protein
MKVNTVLSIQAILFPFHKLIWKGGDIMFRIFDFQSSEPRHRVDNNNPLMIPHTPNRRILATIHIDVPNKDENNNRVELISTVGVRGLQGTSQLLFRIFRDGREIFNTQEGVESDPESEVNYTVSFQTIDKNLHAGCHRYELTVENLTTSTPLNRNEAAVVGPISLSGLGIARSC